MDYKLYRLGGSAHIVSDGDIVVRDDLAVLQEAEQDSEKFAVEAWQGARRVPSAVSLYRQAKPSMTR